MGILERFLRTVARIQYHYVFPLFVLILIFTVVMGIGMTKVEMNSDINEEMPQELPIFQLNDKINDKFGAQDTLFVLVSIDDASDNKNNPQDIRDPEVIDYLRRLSDALSSESSIEHIISLGSYLPAGTYTTLEDVKTFFASNDFSASFVSDDYKHTFLIIRVDVGSGEQKVIQVTDLIRQKVADASIPSGVKVRVTGTPPIRVTILSIMQKDASFTILLASLIILILLFFTERSITRGALVFIPTLFGLIWTLGMMGWIGIKLSVATVGIGAMILGLGVEYGVFMYTRYREERDKGHNHLDSLQVSVPAVGISIVGSGLTTVVGFGALMLSFFPMLQHLGATLAMGIAACLIAAVFAAPVIFLVEEYFDKWYKIKIYELVEQEVQKHKEEYAKSIAVHPHPHKKKTSGEHKP